MGEGMDREIGRLAQRWALAVIGAVDRLGGHVDDWYDAAVKERGAAPQRPAARDTPP